MPLARLGQPVDMKEWWIAPQTVGAVLVFQQNAYDFSAALLQAPKYRPGGVGRRELRRHRRHHRPRGQSLRRPAGRGLRRRRPSATLVDRRRTARGSRRRRSRWCVSSPAYHPFPDLAVNGKLTLTENIADLGGLSAAFDAYRQTLGARASDTAYVRQQDREFFIGFARSWRSKISESALRTQLATQRPRAGDCTASPRCATSMPGTTRSTCGRGSGCISSPRRGCGSGNA